MPTMLELRDAVFDALRPDTPLRSLGDDLEQWLSHISVNQPWLTDQANARNHAMFLDAAEVTKWIIDRAETRTLSEPTRCELRRLWLTLAATQATVISLNYDLLLERARSRSGVTETWGDIYGQPLE